MSELEAKVAEIEAAADWNARVALIRRVPEDFGKARHREIYSRIAQRVYVPHLAPDFAYMHWRPEYELAHVERAYQFAFEATQGFTTTGVPDLEAALFLHPESLLAFRLLLGLTVPELAAATEIAAERYGMEAVSASRIKGMEAGSRSGPLAPRGAWPGSSARG